MFTLIVHDEHVYQQLMERVKERGESLDDVLRELLDHEQDAVLPPSDTPAMRLMRLIDETDLPFEHPFNARDAESILSREAGETLQRRTGDDNGAH